MRRLNPIIAVLVFFVLFDSLVIYGAYLKRQGDYSPVTLSAVAPEVTWKAFDGGIHRLKDLKGHVVVLHFWASWCPPCREEFPKLLKAAADNPDIMFLTLSNDDNRQKAEQFIKMIPDLSGVPVTPNVLYAWDENKSITYDQFLTARYPESIIVDPALKMRRKFPGPVSWDSPEIRNYLKGLKEGK